MNGARMKMERILGNVVLTIDSASRFVVIYRAGRTGVPAAALIYKKVGTLRFDDSWAIDTATNHKISSLSL
jgi:hypothetical protein